MAMKQKYDENYALMHPQTDFKTKKEQKIIEFLGDLKGKKVLDVGCNTGEFCGMLLQKGAMPLGIDINPDAIRIAKKRFPSLEFKAVPVEQFISEKRFDAVTMNDVIEHVENPQSVLKKLDGLLEEKGIMVVSTGNGWDYISKIKCFITGEPFLFDETHLHWFNPNSLKKTIEAAGLKVKKITSWPMPIVWRIYGKATFWAFGLNLIAITEKKKQ